MITVAVEPVNCSAMSATAVALSALAMHTSLGVVCPEMTNAPAQEAAGASKYAGARRLCLVLLRGPPGIPGPSTELVKVLVWADGGATKVSYMAPTALGARYGLTADLAAEPAGIDALTDAVVED